MITVAAGTDHSFWVDFTTPDGLQPADANSVRYRLSDATGASLISFTTLSPSIGATGVAIEVLAAQHPAPVSPQMFLTRHLTVAWKVGGKSYSRSFPYRVVGFAPFTVGPHDVRAFLGLTVDDLPDEDVDLLQTYITVRTEKGVSFDTQLTSGTQDQIGANAVILFRTVLDTIPGCRIRVIASNQDGALRVDRLKTIDFDALEAAARQRLSEAENQLVAVTTTFGAMVVLSEPTDRFTGV